jgi:hypothetical protein
MSAKALFFAEEIELLLTVAFATHCASIHVMHPLQA